MAEVSLAFPGIRGFFRTRRGRQVAFAAAMMIPALALLFFSETRTTAIAGRCRIHPAGDTLHEIVLTVPTRWEPDRVPHRLCIRNGIWDILLNFRPGGISEFLISANGRTLDRKEFHGYPAGMDLQLEVRLGNGMLAFDPGNGLIHFPARNFTLARPLEIEGRCDAAISMTPRRFTLCGGALLTAAFLLLLAATAPPLRPGGAANPRLKWVGFGCLAGELFAVFICTAHALCGRNFYPFNTFLFRAGELAVGDDLFQTLMPVRYAFLPYGWWTAGNYFPFTYNFLACLPLHNFPALLWTIYCVFGFTLGFFALRTVRPASRLERMLLCFLIYGTMPVLLLWISGNLEMVITVFVILIIVLQFRAPSVSALLLAAIINFKFYPGALGVLFLKAKQYFHAALCALLSAALLAASLTTLDWNIGKVKICFENFTKIYVGFPNDGLIFSHSLFSIYRYIGHFVFGLMPEDMLAALPYYTAFSVLALAGIVWYVLAVETRRWKILLLLTGAAVFLPPISFDLTLVMLFPALCYFLRERRIEPDTVLYSVCWILLLIPENFYHLKVDPEFQPSILIRPLTFLLFAGHIICSGIARRRMMRLRKFFRKDA